MQLKPQRSCNSAQGREPARIPIGSRWRGWRCRYHGALASAAELSTQGSRSPWRSVWEGSCSERGRRQLGWPVSERERVHPGAEQGGEQVAGGKWVLWPGTRADTGTVWCSRAGEGTVAGSTVRQIVCVVAGQVSSRSGDVDVYHGARAAEGVDAGVAQRRGAATPADAVVKPIAEGLARFSGEASTSAGRW
jgi:hypothetical protein